MPRKARLDFPGTLHHVIVRGIEKKNIVTDYEDRDSFVSRVGAVVSETDTMVVRREDISRLADSK